MYSVGNMIDNHYCVLEVKIGGMGEVYKVHDTKMSRDVLLKFPKAEQLHKNFEREIRALVHLQHPNIVQIYDQGKDNGRSYMVMEFIPGKNIDELLESDEGQNLTPEQSLQIFQSVLAGLAYVHAQKIYHRDISANNIMVHMEGGQVKTVKIIDFGLAKMPNSSGSGTANGTQFYMAPEVESKQPGRQEGLCDQYSAGVLGFYLFANQLPTPKNWERRSAILKDRKVSPKVSKIILKMLETEPEARYKDIQEILAVLSQPIRVVSCLFWLAIMLWIASAVAVVVQTLGADVEWTNWIGILLGFCLLIIGMVWGLPTKELGKNLATESKQLWSAIALGIALAGIGQWLWNSEIPDCPILLQPLVLSANLPMTLRDSLQHGNKGNIIVQDALPQTAPCIKFVSKGRPAVVTVEQIWLQHYKTNKGGIDLCEVVLAYCMEDRHCQNVQKQAHGYVAYPHKTKVEGLDDADADFYVANALDDAAQTMGLSMAQYFLHRLHAKKLAQRHPTLAVPAEVHRKQKIQEILDYTHDCLLDEAPSKLLLASQIKLKEECLRHYTDGEKAIAEDNYPKALTSYAKAQDVLEDYKEKFRESFTGAPEKLNEVITSFCMPPLVLPETLQKTLRDSLDKGAKGNEILQNAIKTDPPCLDIKQLRGLRLFVIAKIEKIVFEYYKTPKSGVALSEVSLRILVYDVAKQEEWRESVKGYAASPHQDKNTRLDKTKAVFLMQKALQRSAQEIGRAIPQQLLYKLCGKGKKYSAPSDTQLDQLRAKVVLDDSGDSLLPEDGATELSLRSFASQIELKEECLKQKEECLRDYTTGDKAMAEKKPCEAVDSYNKSKAAGWADAPKDLIEKLEQAQKACEAQKQCLRYYVAGDKAMAEKKPCEAVDFYNKAKSAGWADAPKDLIEKLEQAQKACEAANHSPEIIIEEPYVSIAVSEEVTLNGKKLKKQVGISLQKFTDSKVTIKGKVTEERLATLEINGKTVDVAKVNRQFQSQVELVDFDLERSKPDRAAIFSITARDQTGNETKAAMLVIGDVDHAPQFKINTILRDGVAHVHGNLGVPVKRLRINEQDIPLVANNNEFQCQLKPTKFILDNHRSDSFLPFMLIEASVSTNKTELFPCLASLELISIVEPAKIAFEGIRLFREGETLCENKYFSAACEKWEQAIKKFGEAAAQCERLKNVEAVGFESLSYQWLLITANRLFYETQGNVQDLAQWYKKIASAIKRVEQTGIISDSKEAKKFFTELTQSLFKDRSTQSLFKDWEDFYGINEDNYLFFLDLFASFPEPLINMQEGKRLYLAGNNLLLKMPQQANEKYRQALAQLEKAAAQCAGLQGNPDVTYLIIKYVYWKRIDVLKKLQSDKQDLAQCYIDGAKKIIELYKKTQNKNHAQVAGDFLQKAWSLYHKLDSMEKAQEVTKILKEDVEKCYVTDEDGKFRKWSDGVIEDKFSALEWCVGPNWKYDLAEAQNWVKQLGADWRLPTIEELKELKAHYSRMGLALTKTKVWYTTGSWVWTGEKTPGGIYQNVFTISGTSLFQNVRGMPPKPNTDHPAEQFTGARVFAVRQRK